MDPSLPHHPSDIQLTLATTAPLGSGSGRGVDQWEATAQVAPKDGAAVPVGIVSVLSVDLLACDDPWGALDGSNEDIAHIGAVVFDEMTGQLSEVLDSRLARTGSRVLVLDRVELEPAWQGHSLAALLVAETLTRMSAGTRVALSLPAPLHRGEEPPEDYEESIRRMQRVWSQVGFQPFRDGVWMLEPHRGHLASRLASLRERHGVA